MSEEWTRPAGSLAGRAKRKLLGNLLPLMVDRPRAANGLVGRCARTTLSISARNIRSRVKKVTFGLEKSLRVHAPLEKPAAMGQVEHCGLGDRGAQREELAMTYGTAAPGSDRLPWLPDERRAPRIGAVAILLASAVWVAVVAAAMSYSPWPISFDAFNNLRPKTQVVAEVAPARPAQRPAEIYGNLQVVPAPDAQSPVSPTPAPTVPETGAPAIPTLVVERPTQTRPAPPPVTAAASASTAASNDAAATPTAGQECRLAKTPAALALCNDRSVASLDREHSLIYNQSWRYADAAKRSQLQRARQKMAAAIKACKTDACSSGAYLSSMREVSGIMSARPAAVAAKPSFSCRGVRKPGQIAVCKDPNLAALDRHQALLYSQSWGRADSMKRAQLQRAQRRLVSRRDKCGSEPCAKDVYLAAMKEVADIMTKN